MAWDIHITRRSSRISTALLSLMLLPALLLYLRQGSGGDFWAYPLAMIPVGYIIMALMPLSGRGARLLPIFKLFIPWIDLMEQERSRIAENSRLIEQLEETLAYYGLGSLTPAFREELVTGTHGSFPLGAVCDRIVDHLKESWECGETVKRRLSSGRLLEFLHREHYQGEALWVLSDDGMKDLAAFLLPRLPSKNVSLPYDEARVLHLLGLMPTFRLESLRNEIKDLDQIWNDSGHFVRFLGRHKVPLKKGLPEDVFFALAEDGCFDAAALDKRSHKVLLSLATSAIEANFGPTPPSRRDTFARIAVAIFACEELPRSRVEFREAACTQAGRDSEAITIIMALLEFREQLTIDYRLEGETFVSLRFLFENWEAKVERLSEQLGDGFEKEKESLRLRLMQGTWYDRLPMLIRDGLKSLATHLGRVSDVFRSLERKTKSCDSTKRVFRGLKLRTIERYLEARDINAYLMTFEATRGSMAQLIECLSSAEALIQLGIDPNANGRLKYIFKPYMAHSRIGVVPQGWSFDQFHETFQKDFSEIVAKREELFPGSQPLEKIELTLQRFGLQDYYAFASELRSQHAIERIKALFAEILSPEDQVALLSYEHPDPTPIVNALIEGTITEMAGELFQIDQISDPEFQAMVAEQKRVLDRDDSELRKELLAKLGLFSPQELGKSLVAYGVHSGAVVAAEDQFAEMLCKRYDNLISAERAKQIAWSYLEALRVIADTAGW